MTITVSGKLEYQDIGLGCWILTTSQGETYQIKNPPPELEKRQHMVQITGKIRDDLMSISMLGTILEVTSFKILSDL